jgi:hypothetical protein
MGIPSRIRVFVPSIRLDTPSAVRLMPFSACNLPVGATKLELVTSGRSVWISLSVPWQYSAAKGAAIACPSAANSSVSTNFDRA